MAKKKENPHTQALATEGMWSGCAHELNQASLQVTAWIDRGEFVGTIDVRTPAKGRATPARTSTGFGGAD